MGAEQERRANEARQAAERKAEQERRKYEARREAEARKVAELKAREAERLRRKAEAEASVKISGSCWGLQSSMELKQVGPNKVAGIGYNENGHLKIEGSGSVSGCIELNCPNTHGTWCVYLMRQSTGYSGHVTNGGWKGKPC